MCKFVLMGYGSNRRRETGSIYPDVPGIIIYGLKDEDAHIVARRCVDEGRESAKESFFLHQADPAILKALQGHSNVMLSQFINGKLIIAMRASEAT